MKLNGWKRLGVVASVVWIIGAGFYTLGNLSDEAVETASQLTLNCEAARNGQGSQECDQRATDYLDETTDSDRIEAAAVAFVPVPLGWGFAYLLLFIVVWIKRGFAQSAR
ncbi:MAG TPA: hypothetical protein VJN69_03310 [Candidatus Acidoferrales bacterium]|nr:hypothetical protein [Candidatus Acidoferrales bacterium]